jgi:phage portal protein BeeE
LSYINVIRVFGSRGRRLEGRLADLEAAAAGTPPPTATVTAAAGGGTDPWAYFFGRAADRSAAVAVPTLAYIRAQLAGGVASMPLERFRYGPAGRADDAEQLDPGWCLNPDPAPVMPPSVFFSWLIDDLFFSGKSTLVVLARDATGFPVAFRRVLPGQIAYAPDALAWGYTLANPVFYLGEEIPGQDVIVINGPHEGVCNFGGAVIAAALALETSSATAAAEPLPNIDLHQTGGEPLSGADAAELVATWKAARALGATAYTPQNLEARPLGFSASDQQMVEGRQYMATQLARMAGVNPVLVSAAMGASSSYVYTNQADYRQAFLDDVLDSYLRAIEGRLSANDVTPRGQYVEFDRDAYTRMPLIERVQIMVGALKSQATPAMVNQLAAALDLDFVLPDEPEPDIPPSPPAAPPAPAQPAPAPTPPAALILPPGGR